MITPNRVTLYSVLELEKFIVNKMCTNKLIRMLQANVYRGTEKLFMIMVDSAFAFNKEFISITLVKNDGNALIPCMVDPDNSLETMDILNTIIVDTPRKELGIDITDCNLSVECIYHDRVFFIYDSKKDTLERYHKEEKNMNDILMDNIKKFLDTMNIEDNGNNDDDDSEFYV